MKHKTLFGIWIFMIITSLASCKHIEYTQVNPSPTEPPTTTATLIPSPTVTNTSTPTPTPHTLGPIYPVEYQSMGVSANIYTGNEDSRKTHYDVIVPPEFFPDPSNCKVISPVYGRVWEIYQVGNPPGSAGSVIGIDLSLPPKGIEKVLSEFNIDPATVNRYSVHLGHLEKINPIIQVGMSVDQNTLLASGVNHDPEPKVAYVLYIWFGDGQMIQVSPCSVTNNASFCGVCYQYKGACPETNMNFPNGGFNWWDEADPFWQTHPIH
jgi:hypothetical protein